MELQTMEKQTNTILVQIHSKILVFSGRALDSTVIYNEYPIFIFRTYKIDRLISVHAPTDSQQKRYFSF